MTVRRPAALPVRLALVQATREKGERVGAVGPDLCGSGADAHLPAERRERR